MKKAILVNDYASVEELNKLFQQGYTVESVDDRSVYILERDELKAEPIKAGSFKPESIRELSRDEINKINRKIIEKSLATPDTKQPHIRIEFDDIRDVPKVWVDGELIGDGAEDKPLVSIKVGWNTDTAVEGHKEFDINYLDLTSERPMYRGFRQGTPR